MTPSEILTRLERIERELLVTGSPPRFAEGQAYKQMLSELDAKGFKRYESVYMIFKAREGA